MVIAARSGKRDPLDDGWRAATFACDDVLVSRTSAAVNSDGLYLQGQVRCEFVLHCDGGGLASTAWDIRARMPACVRRNTTG